MEPTEPALRVSGFSSQSHDSQFRPKRSLGFADRPTFKQEARNVPDAGCAAVQTSLCTSLVRCWSRSRRRVGHSSAATQSSQGAAASRTVVDRMRSALAAVAALLALAARPGLAEPSWLPKPNLYMGIKTADIPAVEVSASPDEPGPDPPPDNRSTGGSRNGPCDGQYRLEGPPAGCNAHVCSLRGKLAHGSGAPLLVPTALAAPSLCLEWDSVSGPQVSVAWVQGGSERYLRHQAKNEDGTSNWGWGRHDGRGFGVSNITDRHNNFVRPCLPFIA